MTMKLMIRALLAATVTLLLASSPALAAKGKKPIVKPPKTPTTTTAPDPRTDAKAPAVDPDAPVDTGTRKGPARIEFDDRLVQGQTNKANAIYLFERRESALRSLLKKRSNFHDEIDEMLEDELVR
ncbi:MAG: hypothetical protein Q8O67_04485 [Deltaproteobacteria bacterium]|nr:hypothetical protein [Deltaproteobacteria bacterium]